MAFRRRNIPSAVRGSARRKTSWIQSADNTDVRALAAGTLVLDQRFTSAIIDAGVGFESTIVRTRGLFSVRSDQIAATEQPFGAFGIVIVSE